MGPRDPGCPRGSASEWQGRCCPRGSSRVKALAFAALVALIAVTWGSFHLGQRVSEVHRVSLYLVLRGISGACMEASGRPLSISIVAAGCLNDYFFVPPLFENSSAAPANWAAPLEPPFEFTARLISRFVSRLNARQVACRRWKRSRLANATMERLYETSRRILLLDRLGEPGGPITALIRDDLRACGPSLSSMPDTVQPRFKAVSALADAEQRTRDAYCRAPASSSTRPPRAGIAWCAWAHAPWEDWA